MRKRNGQTIILITVLIGGIFLSASAIAGLLMFYQLRQANDTVSSAMTIFAADSGIEKTLYCYFYSPPETIFEETCDVTEEIFLTNNAAFTTDLTCKDIDDFDVSCDGEEGEVVGFKIVSFGELSRTERALETFISTSQQE